MLARRCGVEVNFRIKRAALLNVSSRLSTSNTWLPRLLLLQRISTTVSTVEDWVHVDRSMSNSRQSVKISLLVRKGKQKGEARAAHAHAPQPRVNNNAREDVESAT